MKKISDFLGKIRGKQAQEMRLRALVVEAVKEASGVDVKEETISFSATTLVITGLSQAAKSAVFIKKPSILACLDRSGTGRSITDIRAI